MKYSIKTAETRFTLISFIEGLSFLFLLGIAMPVKYGLDYPLLVKYGGWAHGLLFILYYFALADAVISYKWSMRKIFLACITSVLPFGFYIFEKYANQEAPSK
jgi:integral membrane protein